MTVTNRHTFHNQRLLQNACALHPDHYAALSNRYCVNGRIFAPTGKLAEPAAFEPRMDFIPETALPHFPSCWHDPLILPDNLSNTQPTPLKPALPKTRMVWKHGHGVIEKVDGLTGEIMHLAEEYLDKTTSNIMPVTN